MELPQWILENVVRGAAATVAATVLYYCGRLIKVGGPVLASTVRKPRVQQWCFLIGCIFYCTQPFSVGLVYRKDVQRGAEPWGLLFLDWILFGLTALGSLFVVVSHDRLQSLSLSNQRNEKIRTAFEDYNRKTTSIIGDAKAATDPDEKQKLLSQHDEMREKQLNVLLFKFERYHPVFNYKSTLPFILLTVISAWAGFYLMWLAHR